MMKTRSGKILVSLALFATMGFITYSVVSQIILGRAAATCELALRYLNQHQPEQALTTLAWLLKFHPDHNEALFLCGSARLQQQQYTAAADSLGRISLNASVARPAKAELAACLLANYQMEAAEKELQAVVIRFPDDIVFRELLSGLLLAQQRSHEAGALWREFLEDRSADREWSELYRILHALGRAEFDPPVPQSSIKMLTESLERHPNQITVLGSLAVCHWRSGDLQTATEYFSRFAKFSDIPDRLSLHATQFFVERKHLELAEIFFSAVPVPEFRTQSHEVARYRAVESLLEDAKGNHELALESVDRAIESVGNDKTLYARRARLLQKTGKTAEAEEAYNESHRLAEIDLELWNLLRSMGDIPTAEEIARVVKLYNDRGDLLTSSAWASLLERL